MVYGDDTTTFPHLDNDDDKMIFLSGRDVQKYFDGGEKPLRKPLNKKKPKSTEAIVRGFKNLFKKFKF
jgi:hypothetical protein